VNPAERVFRQLLFVTVDLAVKVVRFRTDVRERRMMQSKNPGRALNRPPSCGSAFVRESGADRQWGTYPQKRRVVWDRLPISSVGYRLVSDHRAQ
jgi:hypothetical protein